MDENEGDLSDQFHRNEAISAVADEEDDDYEDLYNDVNVGEGFLQSLRGNEEIGARTEEVDETVETVEPSLPEPPLNNNQTVVQSGAVIPGVGSGEVESGGDREVEKDVGGGGDGGDSSRVFGKEGFEKVGFRGDELPVRGSSGGGVLPPVGGGMRVELGQSLDKVGEVEEQTVNGNNSVAGQRIGQQPYAAAGVKTGGNMENEGIVRQGGNVNGAGGGAFVNGNGTRVGAGIGGGGGGGGTILFVGDLHWWTTDAELESELCKYGPVKEVKFFDEKASGKSKGYCQVEFYDSAAATACKEGMNGHVFNGRPCVVASASPFSVKKMGEAQLNRNQQVAQGALGPVRRGVGDGVGRTGGSNTATGGNYQGGGGNYQGGSGNYQGGSGNYQGGADNNRGFGRGNWGRGNAQGMGGRGPPGPMRNRPTGMAGRGIIGNGGNGFGQGIGATPPLLHHQAMIGQGFDPAFGPMGRMAGYGGFPGPTPPFSGILSSFPPVGGVGLPGVAPHVNPAFFGRGMPMNGMGMMPTTGVEGHNMGMWSDPNMAGWAGEEHVGRAGESSYAEEAVSDHQYGEVSHDRGPWPNAMKEKDRGSERDWSGSSDRRYREDRDPGYERDMPREKDTGQDQDWSERRHRDDRDRERDRDRDQSRDRERSRDRDRELSRERDRDRDRDRHRDERDRYVDHHRYRDREPEYDDEWERGRSSRTHGKSRLPQEEEQRSRSRDADYGKRRRLASE
ncbi:uncharacterized protein LOC131329662 [Rhododendron vialii]|uniref:uncharacterized protein LOC131329662 n=1 Tax=Rhododendron vialii TaxID=182163 RepID=UPI00265DA916|nr:uncharacterized protein LOC131329662 [Rhododendron vialii]XP_058218916.1 uncharacterized protein LOC131329662 [Rhododendron vialii]XP_058218917.1 uncharacterized protein LOC131329662 [Rhododendron vialii]